MGRRQYDQPCSLACALDRIGERWSLLIVRELSLGPLRFSDLDRNVGGAPTDILTKRLRELEQHGIVRRRPLDLPATGVAYELTEIGRELERPMLELGRWGLHFQSPPEAGDVTPDTLPNAIRVILRPPAKASLSVGLRSGSQSFALRIEDGWVAARRGDAEEPDLTLAGDPDRVLAALLAGEAREGVDVEGDHAALRKLHAMVDLPDHLHEAARKLAADTDAIPAPA